MRARHIVTYAQAPGTGGVERAQMRLAAGWLEAGRRVTLVVGRTDAGFDPPPGLEVVELGSSDFMALRAVAGVVRDRRPDILFCPGNHYTSIAAYVRLRLGRGCPPIVGKMSNAPARGDHGPVMDALHGLWLRAHGRFLDHLVAMTPATAAGAERMLGMAGRVSVIPNPPNPPAPDGSHVPLPPGPVILGVGRLAAQKRWDRLVEALPDLPEAELVILGEGRERARLEALAAERGVAARVHLPGHVDCPSDAMARATVVALPSDFEGVPGVLREALSVGAPVVATDSSPAIREIVADPVQGDVVPRGDAEALRAALARRLQPGAPRPAPVPQPGADSARRYLELFDRLTA